jgi:Leucine rich repeat
MDKENGDEYIRRTATFVRTHEQRLADAAIISRRRPQRPPTGSTSVLGWIGLEPTEQPKKPLIFTDDPHHLFYLLMRFEGLGIDVGPLDVRVQNPTRPTSMSYLAMLAMKDKSDVLSISSFRSTMSSVSMFSLGGGWFGRTEPASLDAELKYLYSAFTKLPALRVRPSGVKVISELAEDPPTDSGIPMDAFKNLQTLECHDIDPRTLIGWDRLSEGLRSLTVKRTGLEDVSDLFVDSVIDDRLRREGNPTRVARPRLVHHPASHRSRQSSLHLPPSVPEDWEQESAHVVSQNTPLERLLPPYAWSLLSHLSLSDNNLTFLPSLPALPNLSSLDLSSNLLISIPTSLATLPSLKSLNLSHNMVDSVLGIYSQIPSIISLNVSSNRLDSLCGLERLQHLSRIDLRDNKVEDTDEIGRLAILSGVKEVWVMGNPCTQRYQDWRVRCFDLFAKEGRVVLLDGSMPGFMESRAMEYHVNKNSHTHPHGDNGRPLSDSHSPSNINVTGNSSPPPASPHTAALQQSPRPSPALSAVQSVTSTPEPALQSKARRRKNKRIVDLDDKESMDDLLRRETNGFVRSHGRHSSDVGVIRHDSRSALNSPGEPCTNISIASPHDSIGYVLSNVETSPAVLDPISSVTPDSLPSLQQSSASELPASASRTRQGAGTLRTIASAKSNKRRLRLSPSMYEPASASHGFPDRTLEVEESSGSSSGKPSVSEAEKFRKQIEALRSEVGDSWLKVLSQTHLGSPDEVVTRR